VFGNFHTFSQKKKKGQRTLSSKIKKKKCNQTKKQSKYNNIVINKLKATRNSFSRLCNFKI
jgi:hypothetical protein